MTMGTICGAVGITVLAVMAVSGARAETGREGWLRYQRLNDSAAKRYGELPGAVVLLERSVVLESARAELQRGMRGMLGREMDTLPELGKKNAIVLGTNSTLRELFKDFSLFPPGRDSVSGGYRLTKKRLHGADYLIVAGADARGVLYGVFALLGKIARNEDLTLPEAEQRPAAPIRWAEEWDNLDGSVERGYAGRSIFFDGGNVPEDLTRVAEYARLVASIGINGCNINNVNANPRTLQSDFLPQIARIADVMRPWGVRLSMSVDVSSPKTIGGLATFDPLDVKVAAWWNAKADEIYQLIPDFAGFVVKADSEGRVGPSAYGRTPADAANVIARALNLHGGMIFYRAFVYNHHLDWHDARSDRARAAYDIFHPLDGKFDDNVVVQIKYGPIDFQAREPVSPLLGGLEKTNEAIELQVTQEYTGQQHHLVYLAPIWKEVLDFDLHASSKRTPVKDLATGKAFHRPLAGFVAVVNVGLDENWLAHPFAMANLYAFGRLAWNPGLDTRAIFEEWSRLTFGNDPTVLKTTTEIAMASWKTYEDYTGPLGAQTLTDILGSHYGPGIESSEENGWGQWHRAEHQGIGMDRSVATGTGYAGQYGELVAKTYESLVTTPDELVLFFHHVPYRYQLHSGKTVIQHIYDSHYDGANHVAEFVRGWKKLQGRIDGQRYSDVLTRLEYQAGHAIVWRDAICNYFLKLSGIADEKRRAGHFPDRVEAESMELRGYMPVDVTPWENASGGKAIECPEAKGCWATFRGTAEPGLHEIDVEYFDQNNGESTYRVFLNGRLIDQWRADAHLPATKIGGDSSTRRRIHNVNLRPGDEIRIEGVPDGEEHAGLDYLEIIAEESGNR